MKNISRRNFLTLISGVVAATTLPFTTRSLAGMWSQVFGSSSRKVSPITPNEEFYITSYRTPPFITAENWTLFIKGLVKTPMSITYTQLLSRHQVSRIVTLECVGNGVAGEAIGTAKWSGVPLKAILEESEVGSKGYDVVFRAADGYSDSLSLDQAMDGDVLIAHHMNDETLPSGHGFPARIIVPGVYGMKHVQWLSEIEVVAKDYLGYYQQKGWSDDAIVKTMSWISDPQDGDTLPIGKRITIQGYAFAGTRKIQKVEVSTNGGQTWESTTLHSEISPYAWRFWEYSWEPPRFGDHRILVRATDGSGARQIATTHKPFPDGASGLQETIVTVA